ncbi:MAG: glycosyltransferase [Bacteroidia bacterium]|nr:glycosyltransferase [Bacteroidia bacterium]
MSQKGIPSQIGKNLGDVPVVSIIMNCYNGEKYLREALDSLLAQTYRNWELIFWDNQSMDRSARIFKSYEEPRFKYCYAPRHSKILYEARNFALEKAHGEFIAFLDVDDWWEPEKLEKQVPLFADPGVGIVCGNFWHVDEIKHTKKIWIDWSVPTGRVLNDLLSHYFVGLVTLMVRRSAIEQLEYPCDPRFHIMGDFDLVIRLAVSWKVDFISQPVAFYRWHGNNESIAHSDRELFELEIWYSEMKEHPVISMQPGFRWIHDRISYLKGMRFVSEGNRLGAYAFWRSLQWGKLKTKLFFSLFCPLPLLKLLR